MYVATQYSQQRKCPPLSVKLGKFFLSFTVLTIDLS